MNISERKTPALFWVISILLLLWNLMGIGSFLFHVFLMHGDSLAALPENEQALYGEYPVWTQIVFAIATIFGLLGSILLLAKKKLAKPVFVISLIAILIQMTHSLFLTNSVEIYGNEAYAMPIFVVLIAIFCIWFTGYSIKKRWVK